MKTLSKTARFYLHWGIGLLTPILLTGCQLQLNTALATSAAKLNSPPSASTQLSLLFSSQPSLSAQSGIPLPTQPIVQMVDANGNLVSSNGAPISLAAYTDSKCTVSALGIFTSTTNPLPPNSGIAGFTGISETGLAGSVIYLKASATGLTSACSNAITLSAGNAARLVFNTEPSTALLSGALLATQPIVGVQDSANNSVTTAANSITLAAFSDASCTLPASGTLAAATNPLISISGIATFSSVGFTGTFGNVIYLQASASGLSSACSDAISIQTPAMISNSENSANYNFSCSLARSGNVYCWGDNTDGQLGNGTQSSALTPVEVLGVGGTGFLSGIVAISSGQYTTCALSAAKNVYCWGLNASGELGNNSTTLSKTPVEVLGVGGTGYLSNIVAISNKYETTCALSSSGNVFCWGLNSSGQLGINSTALSKIPVQVLGVGAVGILSNITSIALGQSDSCAVSSGGNVYCWGNASNGQLGDNINGIQKTPVEVVGVGASGYLSNIVSVASGGAATCAVSRSGTVYCWGYNGNGQLGVGNSTQSNTPQEVLGVGGIGYLSGISTVSVGYYSVCAQTSSGNAYCWGSSNYGQSGTNVTSGTLNTAVQVLNSTGSTALANVTSLSAGAFSTCAVISGTAPYCWGYNNNGQLGDGNLTNSKLPVSVAAVNPQVQLSQITNTSGNSNGACAVSSGGNVYCWGASAYGQVGNGTNNTYGSPIEVLGVGGTGYLSNIVEVSANLTSGTTNCALSNAGNVYCWGYGADGELGDNALLSSSTPVEVVGVGGTGYLTGIVAIAGECALNSAGNVYCWGYASDGELGNNTSPFSQTTPVEVLGVGGAGFLSDIASISNGQYENCAVSTGGNIYCWGINTYGGLGNNTTTGSSTPIQVLGVGGSGFLSGISQVVANYTSCALSTAGNVYCWGRGQAEVPAEVAGPAGVGVLSGINQIAVTANVLGATMCALDAGNVYCWGYGSGYEIGNGSTANATYPTQVLGVGGTGYLSGIGSITAGGQSFYALSTMGGNEFGWGISTSAQLGDLSLTAGIYPVNVSEALSLGFLAL